MRLGWVGDTVSDCSSIIYTSTLMQFVNVFPDSFGKEHYTLLHGSVPHVDPSQPDVTVAIAMTNFPSLTSVPPQR